MSWKICITSNRSFIDYASCRNFPPFIHNFRMKMARFPYFLASSPLFRYIDICFLIFQKFVFVLHYIFRLRGGALAFCNLRLALHFLFFLLVVYGGFVLLFPVHFLWRFLRNLFHLFSNRIVLSSISLYVLTCFSSDFHAAFYIYLHLDSFIAVKIITTLRPIWEYFVSFRHRDNLVDWCNGLWIWWYISCESLGRLSKDTMETGQSITKH